MFQNWRSIGGIVNVSRLQSCFINMRMYFSKFFSFILSLCLGVSTIGVVTTECQCMEKKACACEKNCCATGCQCCKPATNYTNVAAVGSIVTRPRSVLPSFFFSPVEFPSGIRSNSIFLLRSRLPPEFRPPALELLRTIVLRI